jgi:hypothetical protein
MQCILYKIYLFFEGFSYVRQIDMQPICTPTLAKFYSCKNKVLQIRAFTAGYRSSFNFDQVLEGHRFLLNLRDMDLEWRE